MTDTVPAGTGFVLIAALAGVAFSLSGVAVRLGQRHHLHPVHLILVSSVMGMVWFGLEAGGDLLARVPARVWGAGVVAALTQYAAMRLVRETLRLGDL